MASPPKPWEKPGVNRQFDEGTQSNFMSSGPSSGLDTSSLSPTIGGGDVPPPIPSRSTQSSYSGYSGYSSPYGGGYGGGYGGYSSPYSSMYSSPYSSMYGGGMYGGGYGMGYNRLGYGQQNNDFNSFSRMAEESSRPAFQSIESIVGAFSSVSMMLDSTFQAVYNSFRAVIGVADNFSRMKMQFAQIFSAFAVFRTLRYIYRKILVLLRLRRPGFEDDVWTEASDQVLQQAAAAGPDGKKSSWPVIMFFAIIMGGPWLIWKFLQTTFSNPASMHGWASGVEDHFVARALYNYEGQGTDELSFKTGANIHVAPKELQPRIKGWLLASVDGKTAGLIPANYVKVLGKRRGANTQLSQLPTINEQNQSNLISQTGPQAPAGSGNEVRQSAETSQNMTQSPSALNFESEVYSGFNSESANRDMNTAFSGATDPLNLNTDKNEGDVLDQ